MKNDDCIVFVIYLTCFCIVSCQPYPGIRTTISLDEVLKLFQSWCLGKGEEGGKVAGQKGAAFKTKDGHIHKVYDYLCKNCSQQQLKDLFNYNPAIFLPDSSIRYKHYTEYNTDQY